MLTTVKARFADGVLTPLEPLDLQDGEEVTLQIQDDNGAAQNSTEGIRRDPSSESLVEFFTRLRESAGEPEWNDLPPDFAKNKGHYLYGWPKESEE